MKVAGLDLSLSATGVAATDGVVRVLTSKLRGPARLQELLDEIYVALAVGSSCDHTRRPEIVGIEGYAYGKGNQAHQIGELGGVVRLMLYEHGIPYVEIPPAKIKMYATGRGNAGKSEVLKAAWKRLGYEGTDDNEADALWVRALLLARLGEPLVELPKTHQRALDSIEIPEV